VSNLLLILTTLAWIFAAMALAWLYRKQATWRKVVLALIFLGIGAYSATSSFWRWQMGVEREAARHLVGVTILDFDERLGFLRKNLIATLEQDNTVGSDPATTIDWSSTFAFQHRDLQLQLDTVRQNAFIQRYYSVWLDRASMHQQHLDFIATALAKLTEKRPKRASFDAYIQQVEDVKKFLGRLEDRLTSGAHDEPVL
jgi:hypothetical protein